MKTSFKLLILAMLILLGTTAAMDFAYRRVYDTGDHNKPYSSYETLKFRDFDRINIVAANLVSTIVTKGPEFLVRRHKGAPNVRFEQHGKTLTVTFDSESTIYYLPHSNAVLIECPFLNELKADAVITINGEKITVKHERSNRFGGGQISVRGFDQDSLSLVMDNYTTLYLKENKVGFLSANLGSSDSSRSTINIDKSNRIQSAEFDIQHNSVMKLNDVFFEDFKYKLSDSAQVNLSGISLRLLSKQN